MAKKNAPEVKEEQKIQTRYDRKMAARKEQEKKDKRDEKIFKIASSLVGIVLVLAIVIGIGSSIVKKQVALNGTYIQIGDRDVTQLEYDFYYNVCVGNYLSTYGSLISYMGLDTTRDFDKQPYDENLTWKDMFDQMTVQQMTQTYAMIDDAKANGFTYDDTADLEERMSNFKAEADSAGITEAEFFKNTFGQYATKSNLTPFIRDGIYSVAYYNHLDELNTPSAEEIKNHYDENPLNYDKVDYRSFVFTADIPEDASEEDIAKAMTDIKEKADAFKEARINGSDFEQLCIDNASDEAKANYEDEETEYCLSEGQRHSYTPSAITDWLYDDSRKENDIEVIENTDSHVCYVVEFVKRYYDAEESDAEISSSLATSATTEYIAGLMENYDIKDPKGKLNYLNVQSAEDAASSSEESPAPEASSEETAEDTSEETQETTDGQ